MGREHLRLGRNNQDGCAVRVTPTHEVGVVTDGCGSQVSSEVGAQLGAQFLAGWLSQQALDERLPSRATDALTAFLFRSASELGLDSLDRFFLFTFLAAVRVGAQTQVFGIGDGVVVVDELVLRLDPGPDNAPPYCAYRLGSAHRPEASVHFQGTCQRVAVMTDGLTALTDDEVKGVLAQVADSANPLAVQRRLTVMAETKRLHDDSSLVVLGGA
jgi:Protein phosphatase 2C